MSPTSSMQPTSSAAVLRLDAALADRGLARSRTHAQSMIADGKVSVNGTVLLKAATKVSASDDVSVAGPDRYVSRGAHKLIAALDAFDVSVDGVLALDAGASTGGFTQVLLERGAEPVIALDVGHGQLSQVVRFDPRVRTVEGFNVRGLTPDDLSAVSGLGARPQVIVADLSFISLTMVLPALARTVTDDGDLVLLIKPQFEVGRQGIKEGIVKDPVKREDAVTTVLWAAHDLGWGTAGLIPSPIVGGAGNSEYLVWFSRARGTNPTEWLDTVSGMTR